MEFYLLVNNEKEGPYQLEDLTRVNLTAETLVWSLGFVAWKKAKEIPELSAVLSSIPPPPPIVMPKTWLLESILATCFCCLPFGVVGLVYATKIDSCFAVGNYKRANYCSQQAKKWTLWSFFSMLTIWVLYFMVLFILFCLGDN